MQESNILKKLNRIVLVLLTFSLAACAHKNYVYFASPKDYEQTCKIVENNIFDILSIYICLYTYPTDNQERVGYSSLFNTVIIQERSPKDQKEWEIKRSYAGSYLYFLDAAAADCIERDAIICVKKDNGVNVYINDLLSKYSICRRAGFNSHLFADELIPILYDGYTGNVDVWHDNGGKYCSGMLENGKRTGEWIWWNRKGEVMQSMSYVQGIALPELEKLKSDEETK